MQLVDVNDHAPTVSVVFLGADDDEAASSGRISRRARPGATVARMSVTDADRFDNVTVRLRNRSAKEPRHLREPTSEPFRLQNRSASDPFALTSHGGGVYVVTLARSLTDIWYRLEVTAVDAGSHATSVFLDIFVDDDRSSSLGFSRTIYRAALSSATLPGSCVSTVQVTGDHSGMITYHRLDDGELSELLHVGRRSGRICTRSWLPCDPPTVVRLAVVATDWSALPPRSVAVAVELKINKSSRVVGRQSFEAGFYSVAIDENAPVGHCVLTVSKLSYSLVFWTRKAGPNTLL